MYIFFSAFLSIGLKDFQQTSNSCGFQGWLPEHLGQGPEDRGQACFCALG
jgi:hypothetical protein